MAEEKQEQRKPSEWVQHMMSFIGAEVTVKYYVAGEAEEITGQLRYWNFNKDSILLETKNDFMWIRSPITVKRKL